MPDVEHLLQLVKEIKEEDRVKGLIVITGDKGLAGAYNHNVLKMAMSGWNIRTTGFMWWENWDAIILRPDMSRWRSGSITRYRITCIAPV